MNAPPYGRGAPLPDVREVLVLRPNGIGDFVFALPALHALRRSYPEARLRLIGLPWHADFLRGRTSLIDEVLLMPAYAGVGLAPDAAPDPQAATAFLAARQAEHIDLALQMYGGGRYSNPFVRALGARLSVGAMTADAVPLDRSLAYGEPANRRLELLQIAALAGAAPCLPDPELQPLATDFLAAEAILPSEQGERLVIVHPGVGDPRRRWPAKHFAAVADALAQLGARIILSAGPGDTALVDAVASAMRTRPARFAMPPGLQALCGLLARARMLLANDTGPLHLALALGTPAVGIFWLSNLLEAAPLRPTLLRPAMAVRTACPICGQENRRSRCPHDASFVADVTVDEVMQLACRLYGEVA